MGVFARPVSAPATVEDAIPFSTNFLNQGTQK